MKKYIFLIVFLFGLQGLFAQARPGRPKVGELPIGRIITWKANANRGAFFVQRSDDGVYYRTIGKVTPEDSVQTGFYTFLDATLSSDEVFYRVAHANHDSGIKYSEAIHYCANEPNNVVLKRISNTHADKIVLVEFESATDAEGKYKIQTDIQDHTFTVYEKPFEVFKGKNVLPIKLDFLDPGFYQVYLNVADETEKFSFVKKPSKDKGDVIVVRKN